MIESFLVSLAKSIITFYAQKAGVEVWKYWEELKELKENKKKAEDYQQVVDSPAGREERKKAEDAALS